MFDSFRLSLMFWRYSGDSTSQVAAISNDCLNPILDSNTIDNAVGVGNCGGTISQQDESGQASAPITSPTIELQRACERRCFRRCASQMPRHC